MGKVKNRPAQVYCKKSQIIMRRKVSLILRRIMEERNSMEEYSNISWSYSGLLFSSNKILKKIFK